MSAWCLFDLLERQILNCRIFLDEQSIFSKLLIFSALTDIELQILKHGIVLVSYLLPLRVCRITLKNVDQVCLIVFKYFLFVFLQVQIFDLKSFLTLLFEEFLLRFLFSLGLL